MALVVVRGDMTLGELARQHDVHPYQITSDCIALILLASVWFSARSGFNLVGAKGAVNGAFRATMIEHALV